MKTKSSKNQIIAAFAALAVIIAAAVIISAVVSDANFNEDHAADIAEAETKTETETASAADMADVTVSETYLTVDTYISEATTVTESETTEKISESSLAATASESITETTADAAYGTAVATTTAAVTHENYAAEYSSKFDMGSEKYYNAFAKALAEHDYDALAFLDDDTGGAASFKHLDDVMISDYSAEVVKNNEYEPESGKITLNITQSNDELFPVGRHEYYIYLEDGMFEWLDFRPYGDDVEDDYDQLDYASADLAAALGYKSYSTAQLADVAYTPELIHTVYHAVLSNENGYSAAELNDKIKSFFGSSNDLSEEILTQLWCRDGRYFKGCGHGGLNYEHDCKSVSENRDSGEITHDIWFYSDLAHLNVSKKIRFTYIVSGDNYMLRSIDCYYSAETDVMAE